MPLGVLSCFLGQSLHEHEVVNENLQSTFSRWARSCRISRTNVSTFSSTVNPSGSSPFKVAAFGRLLYKLSIRNKEEKGLAFERRR